MTFRVFTGNNFVIIGSVVIHTKSIVTIEPVGDLQISVTLTNDQPLTFAFEDKPSRDSAIELVVKNFQHIA